MAPLLGAIPLFIPRGIDNRDEVIALDAVLATIRKHRFVQRGYTIRMVAGFAEVLERKDFLVAGACNHPNCLVLPFRFPVVRTAA